MVVALGSIRADRWRWWGSTGGNSQQNSDCDCDDNDGHDDVHYDEHDEMLEVEVMMTCVADVVALTIRFLSLALRCCEDTASRAAAYAGAVTPGH